MTQNLEHYKSGDTIEFTCIFNNFDGSKIDPDFIKFIVYDKLYNKIEEFNISKNPGDEVGYYSFQYTIPENLKNKQILIYEWNGEIEGKKSLERDRFITSFIGES
jgi:hypothetical protein